MNAGDEQINETSPNHKKYVSIFAGALTAAIALSFVILAFKSGAGQDQKKKQPQPQEGVVASYSPGMADFNKKVEQEVKRRQQMQRAQDERVGQRRVGQQEQAGSAGGGQKDGDSEKSIEEQFKDQERQRALRSRISKSQWLRGGLAKAAGVKTAFAGSDPPAHETDPKLSELEKEQAQLEQMMAQAENALQAEGQGGQRTGPSLFGLKKTAAGTAPVVGRPRSEAAPEPGHRLIPTGTVINCVLDQYTMSDYVGSYRAIVSHDVYDVTGNFVLVPKGAKLTGRTVRISNVNEAIQARMGMPATWIVLPDGKRISLEKTSALDQAGIPAVKDTVNYHLLAQFLGVAAYAMISHETSREGSGYANDITFQGEAGEAFRSQFAPLIQKYLDLVPTITLAPGTPVKLFIEDDIYARPWRSVYGAFISNR